MTGRGVLDLQVPLDAWNVGLHSRDFESVEAPRAEDAKRARMLRKRAKSRKGKRRRRALALADELDPEVTPDTPQTSASARYLRERRIRILSWVWKSVAEDATGKVARFDIIKPAWACSQKGLCKETPHRIRAEFRADLNRAKKAVKESGDDPLAGFIFAVLHGEFESQRKLYQLHWHLVATGDWVAVVDRLRLMKAYQPIRRVKRPIRARRQLHDGAYAVTYLMKSYWPGTWCGYVSGQTNQRRRRQHGRIPEPFHSSALLWLHRWSVSDMVLMKNMRVCKSGLVVKTVYE